MRINTLAFARRIPPVGKKCYIVVALQFTTISIRAQNVTIMSNGITSLPIGYYPCLM